MMKNPMPVSAHIHPMMSLIRTAPLSFLLASPHADLYPTPPLPRNVTLNHAERFFDGADDEFRELETVADPPAPRPPYCDRDAGHARRDAGRNDLAGRPPRCGRSVPQDREGRRPRERAGIHPLAERARLGDVGLA